MTSTTKTDLQELMAEAQAHRDGGRREEALTACNRIAGAAGGSPDALAFAGRIAAETGHRLEAREFFRDQFALLDRADADAREYYKLGTAFHAISAPMLALAALKKAANKAPNVVEIPSMIGDISERVGDLDTAEKACLHALALDAEHADTLATYGVVLHRTGRVSEAVEAYRKALLARPEFDFVRNNLFAALIETGDPAAVVDLCELWLESDPGDTETLSFLALAQNELGNEPEAARLYDFDRLIRVRDIDCPEGFASLEAFNDALEAHVMSHPQLHTPPEGHPTWHHPRLQIASDLLAGDPGPAADLERIIRGAVADYRSDPGMDPDHPFLANIPDDWRLVIWGAVLNGAGNQQAHIHEDGYLSGVYYVRVPDEVSASGDDALAGGFEAGRPPEEIACRAEPRTRSIKPHEGLMILFPAYMYHRTIPFESDTRRISIAFDIVPA